MSVKEGTRPGSKPEGVYVGWDYIRCQGPGWDEIRAGEREVMRWEGEMQKALAATERLAAALNVAYVFLHGGHVERGTMARSGLKPDMNPAAVLAHVKSLLTKDVPALR